MGAIGRLSHGFAGAVAATALFATPACAQQDTSNQEPQATQVAMVANSNASSVRDAIEFLPDADRPANMWVVDHPERVAVSVHLGTQTTDNIIQNIEPLLREHFEANGVTDLAFFWERGTAAGTTLAYHTDHYVYGPFGLNNALDNVAEAVRQNRFDREVALNR